MADEVERRLERSEHGLRPAIERLAGNRGYYVGVDRKSGTMTNTSLWESLEDAQAMATLPEMLALRGTFGELGAEGALSALDFESEHAPSRVGSTPRPREAALPRPPVTETSPGGNLETSGRAAVSERVGPAVNRLQTVLKTAVQPSTNVHDRA